MRKLVVAICLLSVSVWAESIYTTFDVAAMKKANLSLTMGGTIDSISVDIGSHVKENDVLVTLENSELKAALELAKSRLELARINEKYAKRSFERFEKVKTVIDEGEYDRYAAAYEKAKSSVTEAKVNIKLKESQLNKTRLHAPFDGIISEKPMDVGDVVSGGIIKTILKIQSATEMKLLLHVDQKYWKKLKVGQEFTYKIDGDEREYSGKISKIYPTANSRNRKIIVEVPATNILPGLFGEGEIEVN